MAGPRTGHPRDRFGLGEDVGDVTGTGITRLWAKTNAAPDFGELKSHVSEPGKDGGASCPH